MTAKGANKVATLTDADGKTIQLPIIEGTIGPSVIDVRKLYGDTGHFTYDPGYTSTGSCESKITYIDGYQGILLHRGYAIEDLAEKGDFLEVAYLILNGELPNKAQKTDFMNNVTYHTMVHEQMTQFWRGFRRDAHPMAVMCGVVGALSAFYHDSLDIQDPESRRISAFRLVAKDRALAELKKSSGLADVIEGLPQNPLPDAFVIEATDTSPAALEALRDEIRQWPRVAHVQLDAQWARRLDAGLRFARVVAAVLGTLLGIALVAVTFNTIRLQVLTRREEIEVIKLIGATDAFIQRPFLYFGALQGLAGGAVPMRAH